MRIPLILIFTVVIVCPSLDIYIWRAIRRLRGNPPLYRATRSLQIIVSALAYLALATGFFLPHTGGSDDLLAAKMWLLFTFISVYIPKALFVIIDLLSRIPCIVGRRGWGWLSATGATLALILAGAMWYGALVNRFHIDVKETDIPVTGLPAPFDGMRIVQISDLHTGTYGNDTSYVALLVDTINALRPDMIVFTGDIVNRNSYEIEPHIAPLSRLSAPHGVYAILGNHDYGDYYSWPSAADKERNMQYLFNAFRRMGWRLLRNETAMIHHRGDSLALIGVENIGDPPFPVYGSLDTAYPRGADGVAKILLSHNPAHWENDIARGRVPNDIALTLSGHTHAMQMELLGLSPAALRYPAWGGLYDDGMGRSLYVNIGIGTVGLPMRLGATPEITLLTLRPASPPSNTH